MDPVQDLHEESAAVPHEDTRTETERERDEYKEGWMRAKADFQNYKRTEGERVAGAIAHGLRSLVEDLFLVLDSFTLAGAALQNDSAGAQGISMIRAQLLDVLKRYGVEPITTSELLDQEFDPSLAEAIGTQPSDKSEGTVIAIVQEGYRFNGKVLRPARVYLASPQQSS